MTDETKSEFSQVEESLLRLAADVVKASLTEVRQGSVKLPLAELMRRLTRASKTTRATEFARRLLDTLAQEATQAIPAVGRPQLVGRDRDLAQFEAILQQRQPTLVVISGEAKMGKTNLLDEFKVRAKERGWKTAFYNDPGGLGISSNTTADTFAHRVREQLDLPSPSDDSLLEMPPDLTDSGRWRREALRIQQTPAAPIETQPSEEAVQPSASPPSTALDVFGQQSDIASSAGEKPPQMELDLTESTKWRRDVILKHLAQDAAAEPKAVEPPPRPSTTPRHQPLLPLIQQLAWRSPILLLIDGYRPAPGFAIWFTKHFITDLKRSAAALIVVVAVRPTQATMLIPHADTILSVGPLYTPAVRHHFQETLKQITPPLKTDELEAYVQAASKEPEIFGTLARLLILARPAEQ